MSAKQPTARRRQLFVLTPEEKRTIAFVLCALVLGITTKHYRDKHPRPPEQLKTKQHHSVKSAAKLHGSSPSPTAPDAD